jgi:hypothetical protein
MALSRSVLSLSHVWAPLGALPAQLLSMARTVAELLRNGAVLLRDVAELLRNAAVLSET